MAKPPAPIRHRLFDGLAPWLIGNLLIAARFAWDLRDLGPGGRIGIHAVWGRDFINLWTAGRLLLEGKRTLLYDVPAYHAYQVALFGSIDVHNYSYPPLALPLALPFGLLPYGLALVVWLVGTGWLFARAAAPWWREAHGWPAWLTLLTPAALVNVWAGHYGFLIGALWLFGWRAIEGKRPIRAGLCFGLMAIKPHLAILLPLLLLARGEWRVIAATAATLGLLLLASLLLFGLAPWQAYLGGTASMQAGLIDARGSFFGTMSTSTATALFALGAGPGLVAIGQVAMALLGIALAWIAARRGTVQQAALLGATTTFLILPYGFCYDLTVVGLGALLLMRAPTAPLWARWAGLGGFLAPQLGMFIAASGVPVMPLLLAGLALAQARPLINGRRDGPTGAGAAR